MNLLTFGLVADRPLGDRDFFGLPLVVVGDGDVLAFGVEAHGPPSTDATTLVAFDELIRDLAEEHAVVPHRFGVIAPVERIESDLRRNAELLNGALDRVAGRDEWSVRIRPRDVDVVGALGESERERLRETAPMERGMLVHRMVTNAATHAASELTAALATDDRTVHSVAHDDALGADVVALLERSVDARELVGEHTVAARRVADVELVGPGPAYRSAGMLTRFLRNDARPVGATR